MNADELKLITETITALGSAGKDAFIWWLMVKYVISLVGTLIGLAMGVWLAVFITKAVRDASQEQAQLQDIRRVLCPRFGGYYIASEHREVMNILLSKEQA